MSIETKDLRCDVSEIVPCCRRDRPHDLPRHSTGDMATSSHSGSVKHKHLENMSSAKTNGAVRRSSDSKSEDSELA